MAIQMKSLAVKRDVLVPFFQYRKEVPDLIRSAMLREIFRLRYEVYCLERGYLPAQDFSDGFETDEYDACSTHFAAYNWDNEIVGSVRLVQPSRTQPFPFEEHCPVFSDYNFPPREQAGEVSRLVVRKTYRRRRGDSLHGISKDFMDKGNAASIRPHPGGTTRSGNSPLLLLGMYRELYRHSRQSGIRYWYAAMERSLARCLEKMGFPFVAIGPESDYYGAVTPFVADLHELSANLRRENKFLAAWFNDDPLPFWLWCRTWIQSIMRDR